MEYVKRLCALLSQRRDIGLDLLRIYLGIGLFVRGALFISNPDMLLNYLDESGEWFWPFALSHYVALAHMAGGLMLAIGLFTRAATLAQIPPLAGAVFFVHAGEGLFSRGQSLELSALVLAMLGVLFFFGAGRLSVDHYLNSDPSDGDAGVIPVAASAGSGRTRGCA